MFIRKVLNLAGQTYQQGADIVLAKNPFNRNKSRISKSRFREHLSKTRKINNELCISQSKCRRWSTATVAENRSVSACDHRIKGFPFCQDCIVSGVELLRHIITILIRADRQTQTSPVVATILSLVCPGLGAAYNGQTTKALIYFAVFVGLFQMAILTGGMPIFVLGFMGMWVFAAVDAWRTAQLIRSGVTPDGAEDIIVQRFSGNPKALGNRSNRSRCIILFADFFEFALFEKFVLPVLLIGLGIYLLRVYIFKAKTKEPNWTDYPARTIRRILSAHSATRHFT